ncbi:MAG: PilZ domain-containing protein, partial [Acidobacteriia bacterium]|nr:PilZ domain-containing protein [Terriglobia bacterium]
MSGVAGSENGAAAGRASPSDRDRRRSDRILLTIPIIVEGLGPDGKEFSETTRTLVINRQGARIQLSHRVSPGTLLRIKLVSANRQAEFRVIGPTRPLSYQGGEWGVECVDKAVNLWGIGFPPSPEKEAQASALLECRDCHSVNLTRLTLMENEVLTESGLLTKECKRCGRLTSWGYTEQSVGVPVPGQEAEPSINEVVDSQAVGANRRAHRRVALKLPVRLRSFYGTEELAQTENVSKGGLCFISDKTYQIGEVLLVI